MSFKKIGSPQDTISVRSEGKTSVLCPHCKKMTASSMGKQAFALGEQVVKNCAHCGKPL